MSMFASSAKSTWAVRLAAALVAAATVAVGPVPATSRAQNLGLVRSFFAQGSAIACTPMTPVPFVAGAPAWQQTHGAVYHRGSSLASITLFCPVQFTPLTTIAPANITLQPTKFFLRYMDTDGAGSAARVTAALKYVDAQGGVVTVSSLDSNQQGAGNEQKVMSTDTNFAEDMTFLGQQYYVQISITRSSDTQVPSVYGFAISR